VKNNEENHTDCLVNENVSEEVPWTWTYIYAITFHKYCILLLVVKIKNLDFTKMILSLHMYRLKDNIFTLFNQEFVLPLMPEY